MISTLKNSMRQVLEGFGLLPMNRADYRHSWTYTFELFKRKESKNIGKTLIHVYTSCKQTAHLTDTEKVLRNGICICVTLDRPKTSNAMVKLVTELYKSTLPVVCDFHFPRMLSFLNPSCLACFDNIALAVTVKYDKLYASNYGGCFGSFTFLHFALCWELEKVC